MHRYEIASLIRARGKDQQMDVKWGSLYTVVQNLAKHGFLEVVGTSRQGARPERTVYRITDAGRQELTDWTRELIVHAGARAHPVRRRALGTDGPAAGRGIELLQKRLARWRRRSARARPR